MTKEDKELLLKDLYARLPYNVVVNYTEEDDEKTNFNCFLAPDMIKDIKSETAYWIIKPYLRPMSSMTEEEIKEFILISDTVLWLGDKRSTCILSLEQIDWLNEHHFDYRGLIEKELALEAPEGMYKTE
jgi:hypothetical protein